MFPLYHNSQWSAYCLFGRNSYPGKFGDYTRRTYDCPECGLSIDRDLFAEHSVGNASINLRKRVLIGEVSSECKTHSRNAVGLTVDACGRSAADSSGSLRSIP